MKSPYLKIIFSFVFAVSILPPLSRADSGDQAIAQAKEQVAALKAMAEADATSYLRADYGQLAAHTIKSLQVYASGKPDLKALKDLSVDLEKSFRSLAAMDFDAVEKTREAVEKFMAEYERLVRTRFKLAWSEAEQTLAYDELKGRITGHSLDFENICREGRANGQKVYATNYYRTPGYISAFSAKISPNFAALVMDNSAPIVFTMNYTSATGGSQAANEDRSKVIAGTFAVANTAVNFWIGAQVAPLLAPSAGASTAAGASLFGQFSGAMVAAAPYALAVAVAVMVIVDTMAREEAYKLGEKLSKANRILREKSPKASDVAAFYREQCEKYLGASKNLLGIFATLAGSGASEALSAATAKIPELEVWENKSQSISTEYCQINLYQLAEKEGCKSFDDIQGDRQKFAEAHQTDSKALCYEDKKNDRIVPITASCQLPIATEARKAAFDDAQKKVDEYNATYSFDKTMELLNAKMTMVMSDQSGIIQGIRDLEFEPIDKQQRLTFAKLIKFINILQRSRPLADGEKALVAELAIQKQFTSLRSKYLDLVRDTLDLIFGNKTKKEVLARMKLYNEELKPFYEKYLHIEVVMDLRDDFSALVRDVNGL